MNAATRPDCTRRLATTTSPPSKRGGWCSSRARCPLAIDGSIPDALTDQVDQVVANTLLALEDAGATPGDVVRTVIYVASGERPDLSAVWQRLTESALGPAFSTASTLLGVACLGFPGQLVELDVTAALA